MDELSSVRSSLRVVSGDQLSLEVPAELFSPAEFAQFEGTVAVDEFECGPDSYRFSEPLSWHADVSNTGDALLVTGSVTGEARTDCARCLEDAVFDVEGEIEGYFLLDGAEIPEGADEDEFDRLPANHVLDMESLVVAAIVFELPLVITILGKMGILTSAMLKKYQRIVIFLSFVAGAIITPTPDVFTQSMIALPMIVLYEVGYFIVRFILRR